MSITAAEVNKLRQQTGAGMMDCKKALEETSGNFEEAIVYLRKKGAKISDKRADKENKEGVVIATTTSDYRRGVIIRLACETDFVAKGDDYVAFAKQIAEKAANDKPSDIESLKAIKLNDLTIGEMIDELCGKIGERIVLNSYEQIDGDYVASYVHAGNKIGVITAANKSSADVLKDICMQIAAMSPLALDETSVDQATIEKELEIAKEQIRAEGKPEEIVDKIAQGKLQKFYKESTLIHQQFVKDGTKSVKDVLNEADPELKLTAFRRVQLGIT